MIINIHTSSPAISNYFGNIYAGTFNDNKDDIAIFIGGINEDIASPFIQVSTIFNCTTEEYEEKYSEMVKNFKKQELLRLAKQKPEFFNTGKFVLENEPVHVDEMPVGIKIKLHK